MADNLTLPASGTGTATPVVATDDVAGVHYQKVKLDLGGDGLTVPATGDASNGLDVDVTRVSGNVTVVQSTATNLKVDASGVAVPVTDNAGSLTVDGTVTANLAAGNNNIGDVDVASIAAGSNLIGKVHLRNPGNTADLGDATNPVRVDPTGSTTQPVSGTVTANAGTGSFTVAQATAANLNAQVVGNIAHDGVDSGNPVGIAARAIAHGANPTAVAAADRTVVYANRAGVPFVIGGHPNVITIRANYTAAQTDTAIVSVATGSKIVVTRCSVTADNANSVNVQARIGFGAVNTPTTTGVVLSHPGIAAGSGVVEGAGAGILGVGADGEDLRITSSVPTSGSIDVVVSYYTVES